jgi:acyl-[acyl-carrier-protein]-phospholipid O-acyltransferase / long-chain-fatty-acid--[acyl-carrier-protein] ligase
MNLKQKFVRFVVGLVFRLRCRGASFLIPDGVGRLVICNHQANIDLPILASLLVDKSWFIVSKQAFPSLLFRWIFSWVHFVDADSLAGQGWKPLTDHLGQGGVAAIFPEMAPSEDGSFAKMVETPLQSARQAKVPVVAIYLSGSQYHHTSSREPSIPRHFFPKTGMTILPPEPPGTLFPDLLGRALVVHFQGLGTLWGALCRVGRVYGHGLKVVTDSTGVELSYRQIFTRSLVLGKVLAKRSSLGERVAILLPTSAAGLITFFALHAFGRVPVLLNFTSGSQSLLSACKTGHIKTILTSRLFVKKAGLSEKREHLAAAVEVLFLEDLRNEIGIGEKLQGFLAALWPERRLKKLGIKPDDEAVVLFTSGSEGEPKGVVLSHDNLLSNIQQIRARIALHADDVFLNVLPLFHAFGLTVGTLAPLLAGVRSHYHPSPLEYKKIPELAYRIKATVLAGTNTFLAGYARSAHPYDFHTVRLVVAGAEALREDTRVLWMEKFGIRIFEGYGVTEASPVIAVNTAIFHRAATVGRLLPGIDYRLLPVSGIKDGGLLLVKGANIMLGYLRPGGDGKPEMAQIADLEPGWYDTGDVVVVDDLGYVCIVGRIKRFAKIGGEMISLATVEKCADTLWPDCRHAVVALPDSKKGESINLVTERNGATRKELLDYIAQAGFSKLHLPAQIIYVPEIPMKGTGKIDYPEVTALIDGGL